MSPAAAILSACCFDASACPASYLFWAFREVSRSISAGAELVRLFCFAPLPSHEFSYGFYYSIPALDSALLALLLLLITPSIYACRARLSW